MLGFNNALDPFLPNFDQPYVYELQGSGQTSLNNIDCKGDETSIWKCNMPGLDDGDDCSLGIDASVICEI